MKRLLLALACLLPFAADAACVWTSLGTFAAKNVCADGDEVAPTLVTEGLGLDSSFFSGPKGITVTAEADDTRTITSGTFKAYTWDEFAAAWARVPELDLTVSEGGNRRVSWSGMAITVPGGRIAWVPSVVVLSAGGVTLYVVASP